MPVCWRNATVYFIINIFLHSWHLHAAIKNFNHIFLCGSREKAVINTKAVLKSNYSLTDRTDFWLIISLIPPLESGSCVSLAENVIGIRACFLAFCSIHPQSGLPNKTAFDEWQNEARGHPCEGHAETNTNSFSLCHNGERTIDQ